MEATIKTISIELLAEKLNGKFWSKGELKRIYLDEGYNTKKMSTKTYVYQNEDGDFKVSCKVECPSQPWQWCQSQENEIKDYVINRIAEITSEFGEEVIIESTNEQQTIPTEYVGIGEFEGTIGIGNMRGLAGKVIEWKAPAYSANKPYGGICKIVKVDVNAHNPLTVETISGDDLSFGFMDFSQLAYSDGGRYVNFRFCKNANS